jgi:hypothetical protein
MLRARYFLLRSDVVEFFRHVLGAQASTIAACETRVCGVYLLAWMLFDRDADTTGLLDLRARHRCDVVFHFALQNELYCPALPQG